MKGALLILALLIWGDTSHAAPQGGSASASCPSNVNGAAIFPYTICTLTDAKGNVWSYAGGYSLLKNGSVVSADAALGLGNCAGGCANLSSFVAKAISEPPNG